MAISLVDSMDTLFPIEADDGMSSLELATKARIDNDGSLVALVRLIVFDVSPRGFQTIRDVKEQDVCLVRRRAFDPRVGEALLGWLMAVQTVMAQADDMEIVMPKELVAPRLLDLKQARTAEDFEAAALAKSRLGWLATGKGC